MNKAFNHITIKLETIENEAPFNLKMNSLFFFRAFRLSPYRIVVRIPDAATKGESLGELWKDLRPSDDGFLFEIATELPFYLPNIMDYPDYHLPVGDCTYMVCNRMFRAHFFDSSSAMGESEYFLVNKLGLSSLKRQDRVKKLTLCPVPMKTFISRKFSCKENNAEDAIKNHFLEWQRELFVGISKVLNAFRPMSPPESSNILPISSPSLCPIVWLAAVGDGKRCGCEQFAGNIGQVALRPLGSLDAGQYGLVKDSLTQDQPAEIYINAIGLAKTYYFYGMFDLAIVQLCTACETLLSRVVKEFLIKQNISKGALKEQFKDVSLSQLLNFFLPVASGITKKADGKKILGILDWARKQRNDIVHYGKTTEQIDEACMKEAIKAAEDLLCFLIPMRLDEPGSAASRCTN